MLGRWLSNHGKNERHVYQVDEHGPRKTGVNVETSGKKEREKYICDYLRWSEEQELILKDCVGLEVAEPSHLKDKSWPHQPYIPSAVFNKNKNRMKCSKQTNASVVKVTKYETPVGQLLQGVVKNGGTK